MLKDRAVDYARARALIETLRKDMDEAAAMVDAANGRTKEVAEAVALLNDRAERLEKKVKRRGRTVGILAIFAALEGVALWGILSR